MPADLPRFFAYATKVATRYAPLRPLLALIEPMSGLRATTAYLDALSGSAYGQAATTCATAAVSFLP